MLYLLYNKRSIPIWKMKKMTHSIVKFKILVFIHKDASRVFVKMMIFIRRKRQVTGRVQLSWLMPRSRGGLESVMAKWYIVAICLRCTIDNDGNGNYLKLRMSIFGMFVQRDLVMNFSFFSDCIIYFWEIILTSRYFYVPQSKIA